MRLAVRAASDPLVRFRLLWLSFAWLLAVVLALLGAAYAFGGRHVLVTTRAFVVLIRWMPYGLHGHGAVLLVVGLALGWCLLAPTYRRPIPWRYTRRVLLLAGAYLAWNVYAFATAQWAGGSFSLTGVVIWCALMIIPFVLVMLPPPGTRGVGS